MLSLELFDCEFADVLVDIALLHLSKHVVPVECFTILIVFPSARRLTFTYEMDDILDTTSLKYTFFHIFEN
jgi:hypothetical protein